jgi:hypothetical protein
MNKPLVENYTWDGGVLDELYALWILVILIMMSKLVLELEQILVPIVFILIFLWYLSFPAGLNKNRNEQALSRKLYLGWWRPR